MKKFVLGFLFLSVSLSLQATRLQDYDVYQYDLRFTNPLCDVYEYTDTVYNRNGELLLSKPKNVWCGRADMEASAAQLNSPQRKIIEWIRDPNTEELFMAFLSFSNSVVFDELCAAVEERNLKVTLVMDDAGEDRIEYGRRLESCQPASGLEEDKVRLVLRGHNNGLGYAHNKVIIVNPQSNHLIKIAYASANLSSGTVLHHENWHFVDTVVQSHFAQIHLCLKEGLETAAAEGRSAYMTFVRQCRSQITYPEEEDIKVFLAPGEHRQAERAIMSHIEQSKKIDLAAHRLSWGTLIENLKNAMNREVNPLELRTVVDDDLYWVGQINRQLGPNTSYDYGKLMELIQAGAENHYMETNHNEHLLHHNKYLIFYMNEASLTTDTVFTGAGNFYRNSFSENLENYYLINIPEVVEKFKEQYRHVWEDLSTTFMEMPLDEVRAERVRDLN